MAQFVENMPGQRPWLARKGVGQDHFAASKHWLRAAADNAKVYRRVARAVARIAVRVQTS